MEQTEIYWNKIKLLALDVDGVLTDGSLILLPGGAQVRTMNVKDGYALKLFLKAGLQIVIITAGNSVEVEERLQFLGISDVYINVHNKLQCLQEYIIDKNIAWEEVAYMGDDIPDMECLHHVGIASCPQDAVSEVKSICHYIAPQDGGKGCVRDVVENILKSQSKWSIDTNIMSR